MGTVGKTRDPQGVRFEDGYRSPSLPSIRLSAFVLTSDNELAVSNAPDSRF